jgi:hypothetical protein
MLLFFVVACALLALGIYGRYALLAIPSAIAVMWAAWVTLQAGWRRRELRRLGHRDPSRQPGN